MALAAVHSKAVVLLLLTLFFIATPIVGVCNCSMFCCTLLYLLDNIFIRFGSKLYRQSVGITMGTNCAPLVADLFLFCYVVSVRQ